MGDVPELLLDGKFEVDEDGACVSWSIWRAAAALVSSRKKTHFSPLSRFFFFFSFWYIAVFDSEELLPQDQTSQGGGNQRPSKSVDSFSLENSVGESDVTDRHPIHVARPLVHAIHDRAKCATGRDNRPFLKTRTEFVSEKSSAAVCGLLWPEGERRHWQPPLGRNELTSERSSDGEHTLDVSLSPWEREALSLTWRWRMSLSNSQKQQATLFSSSSFSEQAASTAVRSSIYKLLATPAANVKVGRYTHTRHTRNRLCLRLCFAAATAAPLLE